jgi:excisionase family DNA binding protein
MNEPPVVLTVEEAAALLRVSRGAAYQAVRCGDIPSVRIGRTIRVPRHRIVELLEGVMPPE